MQIVARGGIDGVGRGKFRRYAKKIRTLGLCKRQLMGVLPAAR